MAPPITTRQVSANGLTFAALESGTGPLALCLHGFPDTAHTWRHLLPALADAGFHAVAPFTRGYAPTEVPDDGCFSLGALIADADALHDALGGDGEAVLIGHDWGASAAYGAAAFAPERWRRLVSLAIPPPGLDAEFMGDFDQLKRSYYMFLFLWPEAEALVAADEMAFLDRLWTDWSPGYDAVADMAWVRESLGDPRHLAAALGYYRSAVGGTADHPAPFQAEERALSTVPPQPTLYLHGEDDGCISHRFVAHAAEHLSPGSEVASLPGAGHFLHLERPHEVNARIVDWLRPGCLSAAPDIGGGV